jgi:hypothetical protein
MIEGPAALPGPAVSPAVGSPAVIVLLGGRCSTGDQVRAGDALMADLVQQRGFGLPQHRPRPQAGPPSQRAQLYPGPGGQPDIAGRELR